MSSEPAREKIYGADPSEANTRILRLKIIKAAELQRRDILGGLGDPYVKISLQTNENRNQVIDIARTRTVPKTLNPVWNQDFLFRVDTSKHRLLVEIFDQNRITKDEFLGMFFIEFNINIPIYSEEQPMLVRDYPLLKRSVLQRVRGSATVGLAYVNQASTVTPSLPRSDSQNNENDRTHDAGFEIIHHRDAMEATPEQPLPQGWEQRRDGTGRVYYVDHNSRATTWVRPTARSIASASRPQPQTSDRRQIDDMNNASISRSTSMTNTAAAASNQRASVSHLPADGLGPLPPGWQMSKNEQGRVFFIDHINKRTTWIDPRTGKTTASPTAQNDLSESGQLPEHWEARRLPDGRIYFIDHMHKTTTWTDPRIAGPPVPYSRDYERKYREFHKDLLRLKPTTGTQIELHVNRKDIMETSFRSVMSVKDAEMLKTRLWVVFDGEKGLDYGGVSREWFLLLSHEIFNPYYGLFEYSAIDNYTLQINALSGILNEEHTKYFRFIGRVIAMAIYHRKLLEAFFIRPFYKMLLSRPISLADMESVDREYYQSLKYILDNDPADLDLTFVVSEEVLGTLKEHELKPGGKDIPVTEQNKKEYIDLVINYRFIHRIKSQMDALKQGFRDIFPLEMIQVFDEKEVELLISGLGEINVEDWRTHTAYKGGYAPHDMVIQNFWKAIGSFNTEERTRFLQFVTGTSRVPMNGFRELWGSNGLQLFTIERWGDRKKLPRAHTCFNRLDLPPYENYAELRTKLIQAMEMSEAFDGVD